MSRSSFRSNNSRQANGSSANPERSFSGGRTGMMRSTRVAGGGGNASNVNDRERLCARKMDGTAENEKDSTAEVFPTLIIQGSDLVQIIALEIPLDTDSLGATTQGGSTKGFQTDTQISNRQKGLPGRELTKFADFGSSGSGPGGITGEVDGDLSGGVGKWDQFATNEEKFGVLTSFDENEYTTKLDKSNPVYKERERHAAQIASEIQNEQSKNVHLMSERGQLNETDFDEEALYSAVMSTEGATEEPKIEDDAATRAARLTDPSIVKVVPASSKTPLSSASLQAKPFNGAKKQAQTTPVQDVPLTRTGEVDLSIFDGKLVEDQQNSAVIVASPPTATTQTTPPPAKHSSFSAKAKDQAARPQQPVNPQNKPSKQQSPKQNEQQQGKARTASPLSADKKEGRAQQATLPQARQNAGGKTTSTTESKTTKPVSKATPKTPTNSSATSEAATKKVAEPTEVAAAVKPTQPVERDIESEKKSKEETPPATSASQEQEKKDGEKALAEKKEKEAIANKKKSKLNANAAEFRPTFTPVAAQPVNPAMYYTMPGGEVRPVMAGHPMYPPGGVGMPPNFIGWGSPGRGGMIPAHYFQQQRMGVQMMQAPTLPRHVHQAPMQMVHVPAGVMYAPQPGVQGYVQVPANNMSEAHPGFGGDLGSRGRGKPPPKSGHTPAVVAPTPSSTDVSTAQDSTDKLKTPSPSSTGHASPKEAASTKLREARKPPPPSSTEQNTSTSKVDEVGSKDVRTPPAPAAASKVAAGDPTTNKEENTSTTKPVQEEI